MKLPPLVIPEALERPDGFLQKLEKDMFHTSRFFIVLLKPKLEDLVPEEIGWENFEMVLEKISLQNLKGLCTDTGKQELSPELSAC